MNIRAKVLTGVTLLLGLILCQSLVEFQGSREMVRELHHFISDSLAESSRAQRLYEKVSDLELDLTPLTIEENDALITREMEEFTAELLVARNPAARPPSPGPSTDSDQILVGRMASAFAKIKQQWEASSPGGLSPAERQQRNRAIQLALHEKVRPLATEYRDHTFQETLERSRNLETHAETNGHLLLSVGALALLFAGFASYWLIRAFLHPLKQTVQTVNAIRAGDANLRLDSSANDEFSTLAQAFNDLLDEHATGIATKTKLSQLAEARTDELNNFIDLSMDVLAIASAEGRFTRVNSAFTTLLGFTTEEITSRPWLDFVHPDDHASTIAAGNRLAQGETICNFDNRYRCKDGSWKWLSWQVRPHLATGQYYTTARDVTDKKAAEKALQASQDELGRLNENLEELVAQRTSKLLESERRFRMVVEAVKDYAIIMLDVNGCVASWNHGAERIKGYANHEIIGEHFSKFYPADAVAAGRPSRGLQQARDTGRFEETSWRVRQDGSQFFANVVITAVRDEQGALQGYAKITRDITEQNKTAQALKQQQEMLRLLMENLAEGVVACDANGKLTFFNKVARVWHGTDIIETTPEQWPQYFDLRTADGITPMQPNDVPLTRANRGEQVRNAEMSITRPGKPPRHLIASGDALLDDSGKRLGAVVVMHDITERRNAERHNLRTQRLESIGTLAGGIAHDLNNALAPILMGLEMLKIQHPGSKQILNTMENSGRRGAGMVRQLLTFAKGVEGVRVPLDPKHLIREIENLIESTFPKNIELRIEHDSQNKTVLGDATQLHQVLLNLCVNARDAMPDGGTLTIATDAPKIDALYASSVSELKPGQHLRIRVSDTGTGIPADVIERIFEPFFSTKGSDKGTGLGLSTVIGIVRSHGGCVQVYSPPAETADPTSSGTQFSIYLPLANGTGSATTSPFEPIVNFSGQGRTILIVEDESAVREISRAVLESLEFKVVLANNGPEALQHLMEHPDDVSLIITDYHMPKMDGLSLVEKTRAILPAVPIIVSSGRIEKAEADQLVQLGVQALLHKPFTQGDLVETLQRVLGQNTQVPFERGAG